MSEAIEARNLILNIARILVDQSEAVMVEAVDDGSGTLLRLTVAPGDVGKIIGKQGRTARSIRTILSGVSVKTRRRLTLDIVENRGEGMAGQAGPAYQGFLHSSPA